MTPCFIGVGANLGDPLEQLRHAREQLRQLPGLHRLRASPIYRSAPVGPGKQNDYLNAVFGADCELEAEALLDALQRVERAAGRQRGERWGPRTLDLDLLLYGAMQCDTPRLVLPHPRIFERNFVLQPLADLCVENFRFPDGSQLLERLAACPPNPLTRCDEDWVATASAAAP